jgi:hypothetical protein
MMFDLAWVSQVPNSLSEITTEAAASLSTALQAGKKLDELSLGSKLGSF